MSGDLVLSGGEPGMHFQFRCLFLTLFSDLCFLNVIFLPLRGSETTWEENTCLPSLI